MAAVVGPGAATRLSRPPQYFTTGAGARLRHRMLSLALVASAWGCAPASSVVDRNAMTATAMQVRTYWAADIVALRRALQQLDTAALALAAAPGPSTQQAAWGRFTSARLAFKRIEFLAAYYEPSTTKAMNGPALPHVEEEEGPEVIVPPEGLQVIEELLAGPADSARAHHASDEARHVLEYVTRLETAATRQFVTDNRIFDAVKMEIARIVALGLSGTDSPIAHLSFAEGAESLRAMQRALSAYRERLGAREWAALDAAFTNALAPLAATAAPDDDAQRERHFNAFDRLRFIVASANPLARAVVRARDAIQVGMPEEPRAFRMAAVTLFDSGAYAPEAFAPPGTARASAARVALGRALFFGPRLSGDGAQACASCHDPARAFTDGQRRSTARGGGAVLRNAPTILNAGLQLGSFYDLRATYLEDQVTDVLGNADEMHGNADVTATRLAGDSVYRAYFRAAFGPSTTVRGSDLRSALAAYIRSLQSLNARADYAFRGDTLALSSDERLGFTLFMGKGKCGTCHFAPLFNGTIPPNYQESEVEVLGVPSSAATRGAQIDPDVGRFRQTRAAPHRYAFKVPGLRNVALTAPYMHNGVYTTLEQVVDFYNRGGGAGIGIALPNQTLPADRLELSAAEQRALIRFLQALTDTAGTTQRP